MTKYPQTMINLTVSPEGKLAYYTDETVKEAIENARKVLGDDGRIVVRPSGTEPLIRVMVEGKDMETIEDVAKKVASVIMERLGKK
jgi:phosphoglucosamine mutase